MTNSYVKLGDLATYINGYAFKPKDRGDKGLPIIRIQDLTGNTYDKGFYDGKYPSKIEINNGDVLISWSASLGVYLWNGGKALLNQHIFKVIFDKKEIDKDYFIYAVRFSLKRLHQLTHGATMKHIVKKDFDNVVIPYPSIKKQKEIAFNLDKIESIIKTRQQEIRMLDTLIKARFVEMFGDPVKNEKKFLTKQLSQIGKCKNGINFHKSEIGNTVNCLTVKNFENNQVINDTTKLAKIKLSNLPSNDYFLNNGDIVFVRSNGNKSLVGRSVLIFPNNNPTLFSGFCIRFRKDSKRLESVYLLWLLKNESIRMKMRGRGVNIQNLNQQIINNLSIPVPPIELQKEFASFVQKVDKSKVAIQKSLDETQILFDSLMQKYFS